LVLEPLVAALEVQLRKGLKVGEQRAVDAWQALCGGSLCCRTLALHALLLALCEDLAGSRPAFEHLRPLRARARANGGLSSAERQCREDPSLLGAAYEALAARTERHTRGQFFTPRPLARFMARLACEHGAKRILDPAVGAGALLGELPSATRVHGLDTSPVCVALATATLLGRGFRSPSLRVGDFLAGPSFAPLASPSFDAVLCNPPYVRHHLLPSSEKHRLGRRYRELFGVSLSSLSTSYVYFLLEALGQLREGGLLVFLTPADFLDTRYGASLKQVLQLHTTVDELLLFNRQELAFQGVLTTSAITIARKTRPRARHTLMFSEAKLEANEITRVTRRERSQVSLSPEQKWSHYFGERQRRVAGLSRGRPQQLSDYLKIRRGMATGSNEFFVITQHVVDAWGIEPEFLTKVVASARDLPGLVLTRADWNQLRRSGRPCWLLSVGLPREQLHGKKVLDYLAHGEALGVDQRFNCRSRRPWYRQENVPAPDVIITYMNRGKPRFVQNRAGCRVMSVFLNGFLRVRSSCLPELLRSLNSDTTAELIQQLGRTYGGGLLKIEPSELASLPMPTLLARESLFPPAPA